MPLNLIVLSVVIRSVEDIPSSVVIDCNEPDTIVRDWVLVYELLEESFIVETIEYVAGLSSLVKFKFQVPEEVVVSSLEALV